MPERTKRFKDRDPTDYYATTPELALLLCDAVRRDFARAPASILEPGCGAGTFLMALREVWPDALLHGIEIHEELAAYAKGLGFDVELADVLEARHAEYDLIVGNPPFRYADEFIPRLHDALAPRGTLAFVLRLNFLAGQHRYERLWSRLKPAKVYPLPARPGFTRDGGTDATDYMLCVWTKETPSVTTLEHLDNRAVANRWEDPARYPDPRKSERPTRAHLTPRLTLAEWLPKKRTIEVVT